MSEAINQTEAVLIRRGLIDELVTAVLSENKGSIAVILTNIYDKKRKDFESTSIVAAASFELAKKGNADQGIELLHSCAPIEDWDNNFRARYIHILRMQGKYEEVEALLDKETHPQVFVQTESLERLLPTIESQPKYVKKKVSDWLRSTNPSESFRIALMVFDDIEKCQFDDFLWFSKFAMKEKRYSELRDVCVSFLSRHHSLKIVESMYGFLGSILNNPDAKYILIDIWRTLLRVAPWSKKSCITFLIKMRGNGLSKEAQELSKMCDAISLDEIKRSLKLANSKATASSQRRKRNRIYKPDLVEQDLENASECMARAQFEQAEKFLRAAIPIVSQSKPSSLKQWQALVLLAECLTISGKKNALLNLLNNYKRRGLITDGFQERLLKHVAMDTSMKDVLPEVEIGEYYDSYVRSNAFQKLRSGEVPKKIEGRSAIDISVLKNVNLTREGKPRPKKN